MQDNPYESPGLIVVPYKRRRWPQVAVAAVSGPLLALCAYRYYQAIRYGAGEETMTRGVVSCSVLSVALLWAVYRLCRR
jgi:hypothetical protein